MKDIKAVLEKLATRHARLCPRQVLGARMGLAGANALGLEVPRQDKSMLAIVETDGCFVDGIEVATGCSVGRRTLRVEDYGKVGATFVHVNNGDAVRLAPRAGVRQRARFYAPEQEQRYFAQLHGYQRMPDEDLFVFYPVTLQPTVEDLISRPGERVNCERCGEEIINKRQIIYGEKMYCRPCAGSAYYDPVNQDMETCFPVMAAGMRG